ncbi:MAG: FecR domain-containing protein, partial [Opitutae bacterium]|nr:FecR domain-containing protein [Opitutae bacterium]
MKTFRGFLAVIAPLFLLCVTNAQNEESGAGAVILAEVVDPVVFRDGEEGGEEKKMIPGMLLPEGYWVETGQGGNVLLLLSNGTVVTITENSKMSVDSFDQESFESPGESVEDFQEEPSSSNVLVDLEFGSLVVQTKKLNKKSNFDISTPLGVAGIRGTEFKMGFDPETGIQLDVTESTVAFTPRGANRAMAVRAGRGLSLAPGRIPIARPVFPPTEVEIKAFNGRARRSVGKTPVSYVKRSMGEASRTRFMKKRNRREPSRSREENRRNELPADLPDSEPNDPLPPAPPPVDPIAPADPFTPRTPLSADPGSIFFPGVINRIDEFLENNLDVTQARKTGRVGKRTRELAKLGLNVGETNRFYEFNEEIQGNLLKESLATGKRLLSIESIGPAEVDKFFRYSPQARSKMLGLPDGAFANLLKQGVDESLLLGSLGGESIAASQSGNLPAVPPENSLNNRAMALAERFKDTSQSYVLEELLASGGGVLDEEALRKGEVADLLLRDYRLG